MTNYAPCPWCGTQVIPSWYPPTQERHLLEIHPKGEWILRHGHLKQATRKAGTHAIHVCRKEEPLPRKNFEGIYSVMLRLPSDVADRAKLQAQALNISFNAYATNAIRYVSEHLAEIASRPPPPPPAPKKEDPLDDF